MDPVRIVGAGLAGCEAALYLAARGRRVLLHEQKPAQRSPAHRLDGPAELVCSNSLKSIRLDSAGGLFKAELKLLGSRLISLAEAQALPAGAALAVDARCYSEAVAAALAEEPLIEQVAGEVTELPEGPAIVATGPLSSESLSADIERHFGEARASFHDAIAPTVTLDSLVDGDYYRASRYGKGTADYLNAPLDREIYEAFVSELSAAEPYPGKVFEKDVPYFESCLPVEVIAVRGPESLRFGPMRPVGLDDPRTGRWPYAVLQLRCENKAGTLWGLVGCQTRLRVGDQERIFRMIPALAEAEFVRHGAMHRNFFLDFPRALTPFQESRRRAGLYFAGQMTGVEGYVESMGSGLLAARHLDERLAGREPTLPPETTLVGALMSFLSEQAPGQAQPMNVNFGLLPPLPGGRVAKSERKRLHAERSLADLEAWLGEQESLRDR
jgi:methylenetetrahydrofolate--tRNA-(uracil-5-)-methyltransferase